MTNADNLLPTFVAPKDPCGATGGSTGYMRNRCTQTAISPGCLAKLHVGARTVKIATGLLAVQRTRRPLTWYGWSVSVAEGIVVFRRWLPDILSQSGTGRL